MKKNAVNFKKGLFKLNDETNFNFQLNRLVNWDGGRLEDVQPVAGKIKNSDDWKHIIISLGDTAMKEERIENAIAYYRMSEFFMYDGDSDKIKYYLKAVDLFNEYYKDYFEDGTVKKYEVPFEGIKLPVMYAKALGECKDIVLMHGGNDSYCEEFFSQMLYLSQKGFDVYVFEGPGQGGVMRIQGKHFTHEWEKPVKAILDYFHLEDVTIIGASLGGYLAPRAAAFEKRIHRVIAWSVMPNFMDAIIDAKPEKIKKIFRFLLKHKLKGYMNMMINKRMQSGGNEMSLWALKHGMYAYDAKTPYDYIVKMNQYQIAPVADKITQDVFIAGATHDHFINYKSVSKEIDTLVNVHSLTFRLFTEDEDASNHCNCGNLKLVFDTFINWILLMKNNED